MEFCELNAREKLQVRALFCVEFNFDFLSSDYGVPLSQDVVFGCCGRFSGREEKEIAGNLVFAITWGAILTRFTCVSFP